MRRNRLQWKLTTNVFGYNYVMSNGKQDWVIPESQDKNWKPKQRVLKDFYWFRAPNITISQIEHVLGFLTETDGNFYFEVWETDGKFDASLKFALKDDAENLAWTMTETWMKWDVNAEADWKESQKPSKPVKVKVHKDGSITVKTKVKVTSLGS
jgi:hypothetical protein